MLCTAGEGGVHHIDIWPNTEENALQQPYRPYFPATVM